MVADGLTPAMKQYLSLKEKYRDCILLFRMGDFYEMFFEDAVIASRLLEITLTSRDKNKEDAIPLCGFPYHAASSYIARLIEGGYKVAVCEQLEDPRQAKGIVKRDVVRVITPGLVVDAESLEAKENNFLAAYYEHDDKQALSFLDISTGEFYVAELDYPSRLMDFSTFPFREILITDRIEDGFLRQIWNGALINRLSGPHFKEEGACEYLSTYFSDETIKALSINSRPWLAIAAQAILHYVEETQKERLAHIKGLQEYTTCEYMILDGACQSTLELFATLQEGKKRGSLLHLLDETVTAMGGRRLRWWLHSPLINPARIRERLSAVQELKESHFLRQDLRRLLSQVYDLERLGGRIGMEVATARDLVALKNSLVPLPEIRRLLEPISSSILSMIRTGIDEMGDIHRLIDQAIVDNPPFTLKEGGMIKAGYSDELDELIAISKDGKIGIAALEEKERKRTGISSLKIGYNSVFGYYIEVTKANAHLVPQDYVRKQTLVNAERYTNQALKEYEHTVLNAEERRKALEYEIFVALRRQLASHIRRLQKTASYIADLDALCALAEVAEKHNYTCPTVDDSPIILIKDGRHPVIEELMNSEPFVPNDTLMDDGENRFLVVTGPNMSGKSTYIRQVAIITIMAQMGSFVPASEARIGVVDRIFTRIGSADNLARGQSTFMVEMMEVANILKNATPRSLIILDEVGRGTSTFDGLSIAWAVAEFIADKNRLGARTLFATHYHQLIALAQQITGVRNYNIAVREWGDKIVFLHKIVEGGTSRSYGIQVAKLAGIPEEVIKRAKEILASIEEEELTVGPQPIPRGRMKGAKQPLQQLPLFMRETDRIGEEIREMDINKLTPLEALNMISNWQLRLKREEKGGDSG